MRALGGVDADFDGIVDDSFDGDYDFHFVVGCGVDISRLC